jgi:hypothetical protein
MRHLLSWFLLALASSVHAEWMPIHLLAPDDSGQTYFVERESLLRESGFVTFVGLIDYPTPQQSGSNPPQAYSSRIEKLEVKCGQAQRMRTLATTLFSGRRGAGEVVSQDNTVSGWTYPEMRSPRGSLLFKVCYG